MRMTGKPIQEWLSEYKSLTDEQAHTFACTVRENKPLIDALYLLFDGKPSVEELDPVCHQLFEFYRSDEESLKRFALELVPSLINLYLRCLSQNDKKSCGGLEAFLLGVYNLEIINKDGSPKIKTFRIPSFAQSSIYHEPLHLNTLALTESSLIRISRTGEVWKGGPYPHYESINGQNRQAVLTQLMQVYNADIALLASHSLETLCHAASRISCTGLPSLQVSPVELQSWPVTNGPRARMLPSRQAARMMISPALLVEMLWAVNFAMYNGCDKLARDAIRDVHARACYELLPDVQLVTEAILNSDHLTPGGMGDAGPMGISMGHVSSNISSGLSKVTITNASFKTKKLPDDISVSVEIENQSVQTITSKLSPIEEEHKGIAKQVLRLSKGRKKEEKEKEKQRRRDSDTNSNKSLVLNGDSLDSVSVSVVKSQNKVSIDSVELKQLGRARYSEEYPVTNGSNSTGHKSTEKGCGEGEIRNRPNSFHGALVNPDSFSTDL